jgi:uncharacterized membrane protein
VRKSLRTLFLLAASYSLLFACGPSAGQTGQTAGAQPKSQQAPKAQAGKPTSAAPMGPAAPQSTHYPILLLAFGSDPSWSLRVGQKGPERLDRANYPPIALEAAEVTHDSGADSWTYHAKDTATGATLALHLSREACSGPTPPATAMGTPSAASTVAAAPGKFTFRASVEHSQIGTLTGCARIAAELFPKINNQASDDDDEVKNKPPVSTVTNAKAPVAVAFITPAHRLVFKRGEAVRIVAQDGYQPAISHDGKRLLFTHDEKGGDRTISLYDFATGKTSEVLRGQVQQAVWSMDDTRIAFLKNDGAKWRLWLAPASSPDKAAQIYSGEIAALFGWSDGSTLLGEDPNAVLWIEEGGGVKQTVARREVYGDTVAASTASKIDVHPLNPDLLLVSSESVKPGGADVRTGNGFGFFLYEVRSKRRVAMNTPNLATQDAEWSRDGFQIFFTGTDSSKKSSTYRIFWDGIGLRRYIDGTSLVVGQ